MYVCILKKYVKKINYFVFIIQQLNNMEFLESSLLRLMSNILREWCIRNNHNQ